MRSYELLIKWTSENDLPATRMQNTFVSAGKNTVLLLWTSCLVQTLSLKKNINKCIEILFTIMLVFLTYSHEPTLHNTINVVAIFGLKTNCQNANISERLKKRWQKYLHGLVCMRTQNVNWRPRFMQCLHVFKNLQTYLPRVRIELTTLRLWDSRAAYCAIEAHDSAL